MRELQPTPRTASGQVAGQGGCGVRTQQRAAVVLRGPRQRPVRRCLREDHAAAALRVSEPRKQRGGGHGLHVALLRFHFGDVLWKSLACLEVGRSREVRLPIGPPQSASPKRKCTVAKGAASSQRSRCRLQARARHGQGRAPDLVRAWDKAKPSVARAFVRKHHLDDGQPREEVPGMKRICRQKSDKHGRRVSISVGIQVWAASTHSPP